MIVGVAKELKTGEHRVALVPAGAESLAGDGHTVLVEQGAGLGSGFADAAYRAAGATLVPKAPDVWGPADMVVKAKQPIEPDLPPTPPCPAAFTTFHSPPPHPLPP